MTVSKTYRSNAVLLTPLGSEDQFSISSFINNLPFAGLGGGQASGQLNLYLAILNSSQIIKDVAKRFNLQKIYNAENMEATVRILQDNFSASINDDGSLTVSVAASTPFLADQAEENEARELCSEITNYFVQKLDEKYKSLRNEQARNNRLFIEKRYHQNLTDLQRAEDELKQFQKTQGVLLLPEQAEAALQAAADLYAKITTKEIEIAVLENYVSSSHNGLIRSKTELNELEAKFSQMKSGYVEETAEKDGQSDINLFVPLNELPEIAVSYFRLYREVTLQEKLLEFLLPQYEQMQLQDA